MTALEGLLDTKATHGHPEQATGALARATAGRALGSAAGTAVLSLMLTRLDLQVVLATVAFGLAVTVVLVRLTRAAVVLPSAAAPAHRPRAIRPERVAAGID